MSKYKVGDKVVMEITGISKYGECYEVAHTSMWNTIRTERVTEPLSDYTEPLEDKIRRQTIEIRRLIEENEKLLCKIDTYELYGDQHKEEYNQAFNQGAEAAWELARKIVLYGEDVYSGKELKEIFDCTHTQEIIRNNTYHEAAAKVAEWEKAKEEIEIGDVLEDIYDISVKCTVTNLYTNNRAYLVFDDGTAGIHELNNFKKTGRNIDINSFLKQIRGKQE